MTILENNRNFKNSLQGSLGPDFVVTHWKYNAYSGPDNVEVMRKSDSFTESFSFERDLAIIGEYFDTLAAAIKAQFANIEVVSSRQAAFEKIIRNQKLPLNLDRRSNGSGYESRETEWAFRFWCKGLNVSVGNTIMPTKSA